MKSAEKKSGAANDSTFFNCDVKTVAHYPSFSQHVLKTSHVISSKPGAQLLNITNVLAGPLCMSDIKKKYLSLEKADRKSAHSHSMYNTTNFVYPPPTAKFSNTQDFNGGRGQSIGSKVRQIKSAKNGAATIVNNPKFLNDV
jgi:hypothetical protein